MPSQAPVIPAKAEIQSVDTALPKICIPAFAGMTATCNDRVSHRDICLDPRMPDQVRKYIIAHCVQRLNQKTISPLGH
jgi:hypothetical protein